MLPSTHAPLLWASLPGCNAIANCLALPYSLGYARHDGLPHQLSPLLPVVCHGLCLCEEFAVPFGDVVNPDLFRPASFSPFVDCSCGITLVRPSDLVRYSYHFCFRRFTVARISSYGPICFIMVFRTRSLVTRSL